MSFPSAIFRCTRTRLSIAALLLLLATASRSHAQLLGTNTGTFVDWLQTYAVDSVPFRYPGLYGSGFNPAPASVVSGGVVPVITGPVGLYSSIMNYPDGSGYRIEFDAPNPAAIQVKLGGDFSQLTNFVISPHHFSADLTLARSSGDPLVGGGEVDLSGATASNPITNFHMVRPGGTANGLTPTFQSYLANYQAVRWMNNNNINFNAAHMTAADLVPSGQNIGTFGNSYDDIISWANAQPNLQKVWINIPVNVDDGFVSAVGAKFAAGLAPGKQVVVEYGNELWNGGFSQSQWVLSQAKNDPRVTAHDDYTKTAQEAGLLSAHVQQLFQAQFADTSRVAGFLGSQGAGTWFVDNEKNLIAKYYGAGAVTSLYKYQGISYYPGDNLQSATDVDSLVNALYADLSRQNGYLAADKADATASGLGEAVYEWGPNGYLTLGGVPTDVIDAFRADPRSKQWVYDEWNAIKSALGPNDLAMEFTVLGDYWSVQINPFADHEQEQQAIDAIANGTAPVAGILTPEPAALGVLTLSAGVLLLRRRRL
jgi:hypothetical protein